MSSKAHLNISPAFRRSESIGRPFHPLRVERDHLLRRDDNDPARERRIVIRDTLISIMGGISALVPMYIAIQSVMGA